MWQKCKQIGSYLIIIILLPYIITVFLNGPSITASSRINGLSVNVKNGSKANTVRMPLEEYCIGIMAREIPAEYHREALKAQAILVRTAVYRKLNENGCDTVLDTLFWDQKQMEDRWGVTGYSHYYKKLKNAWLATDGQVLTDNGKLVQTPYFRLSNGTTRNAKEVLGEDIPYLKAVECPEDLEATEQIQTVMLEDMDAEVISCDSVGYVQKVRVEQAEVSGEEFREKYHLKSSCFTIQKYNEKLRITTRGVGHGLGMSQYTADWMAKKGQCATEILDYFFEGTKVKEVADIVIDAKNDQETEKDFKKME